MRGLIAIILCSVSFISFANDVRDEGNWYFKKKINKLTDKTDIVATSLSKDVYTKQGLERRSSLVIRCKDDTTDVYLSLDDYLGNRDPSITVRLGDGKPTKQRWLAAEGGDGAFAPNAISFIKSISKHKKVIIGFEPYGSTMQAVEFNIEGIEKISTQIAESCNWKL